MSPTRKIQIANAIIEMLHTNWQRTDIDDALVTRKVAYCDLMYSADRRVWAEPGVGVEGNDEGQEFTLFTEHPLTGGEAREVEQSVFAATGHNLELDIDVDSKCWQMKLEQVACCA